MRPAARLVILSAALVATPIAFGDWGNGSIANSDAFTTMHCGDLNGKVGACWGVFAPQTGTGTAQQTSSGYVGVLWDNGPEPVSGSQVNNPADMENVVTHKYAGVGAATLTVQLSTRNYFGGTAAKSTGQAPFVWSWTGTVEQQDPTWRTWTASTGWSDPQPIPESWVAADANGEVAGGTSGNGGTVVLTNSADGQFDASGSIPTGTGQVEITYKLYSNATDASAVDVTITSPNFIKMEFIFHSNIAF